MDVPDNSPPIPVTIGNFIDAKGQATTDVDVPVWTSDAPTVATVAADPAAVDKAIVTILGPLGQAQIKAAFPTFSVLGSLNVVPGAAVAGTMTFGTPVAAAPGVTGAPGPT
jgi:hypothetical protein